MEYIICKANNLVSNLRKRVKLPTMRPALAVVTNTIIIPAIVISEAPATELVIKILRVKKPPRIQIPKLPVGASRVEIANHTHRVVERGLYERLAAKGMVSSQPTASPDNCAKKERRLYG